MHTRHLALPLVAASALVLAGCSGSSGQPAMGGGELVRVVASTNVYGQIAEEIGGDRVEVTSIVTSAAQDPHSFEPSAQDQLTISQADLIIENGGGYDAFVDALIESSGTDAPVITAVEFSHDWPENGGHDDAEAPADDADHADDDHAENGGHDDAEAPADDADHADDDHAEDSDGHDHDHAHVEGFNEHVWYDPHTIEHLAEGIAEELSVIDPDGAEEYAANAATFAEGIASLEESLAAIEGVDAGAQVFATEPVPGYLARAAGLDDVTPEAFSEAVEEGQDVPPATLLEAMKLIDGGEIRVVITNVQTGGAETTQVVQEAEGRGIPIVEFAETLPDGQTYLSWMDANITALADALAQ